MNDLTGRLLNERFRVLRPLGEGATSRVWLAVPDGRQQPRYAVKVMKSDLGSGGSFDARFREEGEVLRRLQHPGILGVHGCFEFEGAPCMVLDYVEGRSLDDLLAARGALETGFALALFTKFLAALDHAHRAGVIHRDIKPSNLLIHDGEPLLCDFGIARQVGQRGLTRAGITLGTPHYMSPEQIRTPQDVDHRSDLYSAGIMLYEMLTGRVPFGNDPGESTVDLLRQQVLAPPPDPRVLRPELGPALCGVLLKALRKERDERFQGAAEFAQAIERAGVAAPTGDGASARTPGPTRPIAVASARFAGSRATSAVYQGPGGERLAVGRGASGAAFAFGACWMATHRLERLALWWVACQAALLAMLALLGALPDDAASSATGVLVAGVLVASVLLPGWRGNACLERHLLARGWRRIDAASDAGPTTR